MKRILLSVLILFLVTTSFGNNNNKGLVNGFKGVFEPTYQFGVVWGIKRDV